MAFATPARLLDGVGDDGSGTNGDERLLQRLAILLTVVPLVVSAVALLVDVGDGYHATPDHALTEMRTRDVGRHPVLVGLYSRDGWSHPGPALFYLLAVPYRLSGTSSVGMARGALLINGTALVGMAAIARRRGGTALLLCTVVGCGLLVRALGADFVRDPWSPYITVLPFGLLVLLTWSMIGGSRWTLPVAAGVTTFLVQTHIGYVALALPLFAVGTTWLFLTPHVDGSGWLARRRHLRWPVAIAALILVLMWLPALFEEYTESSGNLVLILDWFSDPPEALHSLGEGYRVVMGQFGLPPEWLSGARPQHLFSGEPAFLSSAPPPVLLLPFAVAAVVLVRRRAWDASRLVAIVGSC